jgi:hypothetical protein
LKFFFGGFGDARHVFSTLIDIHTQAITLSEKQQKHLKISLAVNDIKPHPLAKLLIIIAASRKLSEFELNDIGSNVEATKAAAVLMYVFISHVMPSYIEKEIATIIRNLIDSELLSDEWRFIRIDKNNWQKVKHVLEQWSRTSPLSTPKIMKLWGKKLNYGAIKYSESSLPFKKSLERKTKFLEELDKMPDVPNKDQVREALKKMSLEQFDEVQNLMQTTQEDNFLENVLDDNVFVNINKYLLPPFLIRSDEEKQLSKSCTRSSSWSSDSQDPNDSDESSTSENLDQLTAFVKKNWKPNVTMLDYDWHAANGDSRVELGWDIGDTLNKIYDEVLRKDDDKKLSCNVPQNPRGIFDWYAFYFYKIAKSLKFLIVDTNSIEFDCRIADVNDVLSNLNLERIRKKQKKSDDDDGEKFNRIFLSNIPDYHSIIHVFTECMPILKKSMNSFVKCTVLMNTGMWQNYEHYIYSGSLIQDLKQGELLLNVAKIGGDLWGTDPLWSHAINNFKPSIKARNDVINWLTRVLLTFACPAQRDAKNSMREAYSPNLAVFFRAIQYLLWLGYPKHWFQTYLKSIIENNLISCEKYPSESPNKCRLEDIRNSRKIDLSPILIELRTLLSIYIPLLEIGDMDLSNTAETIYAYEIKFNRVMSFYCQGLPYSNVLALYLENSHSAMANENLRNEITVQKSNRKKHLFSLMKFSSPNHTASFFMNTQDFDSMTAEREKWFISLIRTDSWERISMQEELTSAKKVKKIF